MIARVTGLAWVHVTPGSVYLSFKLMPFGLLNYS